MPPDTYDFTGKVVRIEADGFAIIKFENRYWTKLKQFRSGH